MITVQKKKAWVLGLNWIRLQQVIYLKYKQHSKYLMFTFKISVFSASLRISFPERIILIMLNFFSQKYCLWYRECLQEEYSIHIPKRSSVQLRIRVWFNFLKMTREFSERKEILNW